MFKAKEGDKITIECCECGLQHEWIFRIIRGKRPQDDEVEVSVFPISDKVNEQKNALGV